MWLHKQEPIGGESIEVEIDEALIVHRKYGRSRILSQVWLFGRIEQTSKCCFVVPLINKKRNKTILVPLIQAYIKPGSVIYSDSWATYKNLNSLGYHHYVINHSENFINEMYTHIRTQNIEHL
uniref:ISXO2-like transposase domain-containing protein n=1 Tax=Octopus bimaculoides TaxID=37653 RepID=A0A0L8GT84_OCTBM